MLLRFLPGLVCLASFLPCQQEEGSEAAGTNTAEAERRMKAAEAGKMKEIADRGEKDRGDLDESRLTPEQRLARHVISGASQYCQFIATVTPRKLMPGQTGTLRVCATLLGHAVLPAPAPMEFVGSADQGLVSLGTFSMQPAAAGRLESGYVGRPVYENYAVLELPVTMANSAQIGSKHAVAVDLKFDLYDGTSTHPIGRFLDRVQTEIEVGAAPDPAVRGATPRAVTKDETPKPAAPVADPKPETPPTPVPANVVQPRTEPQAAPAPSPIAPPPAPVPVDEAGGPLPLPVWIGGGVLLLGVVLLLARRK